MNNITQNTDDLKKILREIIANLDKYKNDYSDEYIKNIKKLENNFKELFENIKSAYSEEKVDEVRRNIDNLIKETQKRFDNILRENKNMQNELSKEIGKELNKKKLAKYK